MSENNFEKQKQWGKGRRPQSRTVAPSSKKREDNRFHLCTVKTSKAEVEYLAALKKRFGKSWIEIIYRGMGLKRTRRPRKGEDLFAFYQRQNPSLYNN